MSSLIIIPWCRKRMRGMVLSWPGIIQVDSLEVEITVKESRIEDKNKDHCFYRLIIRERRVSDDEIS